MTHIYHFTSKPYEIVTLDAVFCKVNRFLDFKKNYRINT